MDAQGATDMILAYVGPNISMPQLLFLITASSSGVQLVNVHESY